jgi:hypothetical protein
MLCKPLPGIAIARREEGQVLKGRRLTNLTLPNVLTERRRASSKFLRFRPITSFSIRSRPRRWGNENEVLTKVESCLAKSGLSHLSITVKHEDWILQIDWAGLKAAAKCETPPSWNSLDAQTKRELVRWVKLYIKRRGNHPKRHPPLLVQEFLPGHDSVEAERSYFFGLFRFDESTTRKEQCEHSKQHIENATARTKAGASRRGRQS